MNKIVRISFRAGQNWDKWLDIIPKKYNIPAVIHNSHKDIVLELDTPKKGLLKIGIECKAKDLHQSLVGGGIAGILEWEFWQYYLPDYAVGILDDVWIFVAGYPSAQDGLMIDSFAAKHRLVKKTYLSMEAAVYGIIKFATKTYDTEIDLHKPPYINAGKGIPMIFKMLRVFPGMTEEVFKQLMILYTTATPEDFFSQLKDNLPESNLKRLWWDWYYGGVEPASNKLGD